MRTVVIDADKNNTEVITSSLKIPWPEADVTCCTSGEKGLEIASSEPFDLFVVDLVLPDISGFDFLKRLRLFSNAPVIALKKDMNDNDLVRSLGAGADECFSKPINPIAFIAITKALIRRCNGGLERQSVMAGLLRLDSLIHKAYLNGHEISLTRTENIILLHLMRNSGQVASYRSIARQLWGDDYPGSNRAIRKCVERLKAKLESETDSPSLINERGIGFRLVP